MIRIINSWLVKFSDEHGFNACLCWCFDGFLALSNYCAHCHCIGFAIFVLSQLLLVWFCSWACWVCFPFWRFLVLCCDCVQHNVLCNESEFSTVCVIQTVGSPVTRQGLNCFFVSAFLNFFLALCVYTNARLSCSLHKYLFVFYIHLSKFWDIPPWLK